MATQGDFQTLVNNISQIRTQKAATFQKMGVEQEGIKIAQYSLDYASEHNLPTDPYIQAINMHTISYNGLSDTYQQITSNERAQLTQFYSSFDSQQTAVGQLNDQVPVLFFPVRLETTFRQIGATYQLWVRIFPDDIAVYTHENLLTQDEIDQGQAYWATITASPDPVSRTQAWDLLCRSYGAQRAAWVALQTDPANPNPLVPKSDSWTQQPFTNILPDAFVINCYLNASYTTPDYSVQTNHIPDEVKLGFNPSSNNALSSFDQQSGEIVTDPAADVDWMIHFDSAIAKGLGVKIDISSQAYTQGFNRIIALGVKTSLNKDVSQLRVQELIANHHYTDGFSLLKQGTSTNNTETTYSGYSSVDLGNEITRATEREANLFTPTPANYYKTDGQLLCEALGIDFDPLYHIFHSGGYDIRDSMSINNVLWQPAMGYYLTNMMSPLVSSKTTDELRDFFTDYVRGRGALPSIRSGIQPYGILPASVYSRLNWGTNPKAGLYSNIHNIATTISAKWTNAVATATADSGAGNPSQKALRTLAQSPVSLDRVQRLGYGSSYIWNNLVYSSEKASTRPQDWLRQQMNGMSVLQSDSGLLLTPRPKIAQMNFLRKHSTVQQPLVSGQTVNKDNPLPDLNGSGLNYLQLLANATFAELRDQRYGSQGVPTADDRLNNMLYRFSRHGLMLEYYDAACKLMKISDEERVEPEMVNMPTGQSQGGQLPLSAGKSRWELMERPYQGFGTVAAFLDSTAAVGRPETVNLFKAKNSLEALAGSSVGGLELLTAEVMDASTFRLDTWRLALVNQRLNELRGITDGSTARNMGVYLGSYGWLENIKKRTSRVPAPPPTPNFTGTMEYDQPNGGYIHAPSVNQAAAAAVLRSGYTTRANSSVDSPLSVNISSERVRSAIDTLEGIKNGQQVPVLMGYELERYMYENVTYNPGTIIDPYIDELRVKFALQNTITQYNAAGTTTPVQAVNVLDGQGIINAYKTAGKNVNTMLTTAGITTFPADVKTGTGLAIDWIMNVLDAVSDLTTAEGIFQLVQGNHAKAGAVAEAVAKGNNIPEIDLLNTPRTGTGVNQKFTMHFELNTALAAGWDIAALPATRRATMEPYLNRWIGQLLGDPASIKCAFTTSVSVTSPVTITMAQLEIQPLDLVFIANDELLNDDSELAVRVRRWIRKNNTGIGRTESISIDFSLSPAKPATTISFEEIISVLKYARELITACRSLSSTDYIAPTEATGVTNEYNAADFYNRILAARNALDTAIGNLVVSNNALTNASLPMDVVKKDLLALSLFGVEQTVYEYYHDETPDDFTLLKSMAGAALTAAGKRLQQYDALLPASTVVPVTGQDEFVAQCRDGLKLLFGREFVALPQFKLRTQEGNLFNTLLTSSYGDLLNDHLSNDYLLDEWIAGIAKVKKNAATYEFLSILASGLNFSSFTDNRVMAPLQTPYESTGNTERWLGASVANPDVSLKEGRISFGVSLPTPTGTTPANHDMTLWQVGIVVDEWVDMIPNKKETTGIAFQANQPNAKPPQCLLLGLTPRITGKWQWADMVDMINETFDLAKTRAVTYDMLSNTSAGHLSPTFMIPVSSKYSTIGFTSNDLSLTP